MSDQAEQKKTGRRTVGLHELPGEREGVDEEPVRRNIHGASLELADDEGHVEAPAIVSDPEDGLPGDLTAPHILDQQRDEVSHPAE